MDRERAAEGPEESESARLNRELNELMQELRVAQNGILIIVGFLLVIPFTQRFGIVTDFQRVVYYLTFITAGAAAVVIIGPVAYHRMVFRRRDKQALIMRGNLMAMMGLSLLAFAILGVLVLVTDFLFNTVLAAAMGAIYCTLVLGLWYVLPIYSRRKAAKALGEKAPDRWAPDIEDLSTEQLRH